MHISLDILFFNMMNWLVSWLCSGIFVVLLHLIFPKIQSWKMPYDLHRKKNEFSLQKMHKKGDNFATFICQNLLKRWSFEDQMLSFLSNGVVLQNTIIKICDIFQLCQDVGPEEVDPKYLLQISWSCDRHTFITAAGCRWPLTIITWRRISTSKSFD